MAGLRLGVLASGRGSDLQSLLDARQAGRIQSHVVVVISDKPEAKALDRARQHSVACEAVPPPLDLKGDARRQRHEEQILKVLEHHRVDLVVLAGYMRILSSVLIRRYPNRIVNIHPALLPSFPGVHGQQQALDWGVRIAGCTTHFVDEAVDHGPILLQAAVKVRADDTMQSLSERILQVEHHILPRTIQLLEEDRVRVEGRRVRLDPGESWAQRYPVLPDVFYGDGY